MTATLTTSKPIQINDYHLKQKQNAEAKYCDGTAPAGKARLLCRLPAARSSAEIRGETKELKGDSRLLRNDGGTHSARV
jgi:hypothetical protein